MELIVAGFHRSGTSLLTELLHRAGLFVGEQLLGAQATNPYGHFEDMEVLRIHQQVMDDHGVGWQVREPMHFTLSPTHWARMQDFVTRRQLAHRDWGFKEPRVCLFLGAWKYLIPGAKMVMIYRDPGECVRSMEARHSAAYFSQEGPAEEHLRFFREPDHGLRIWDTYNRALVAFARRHLDDCIVIPHSSLTEGAPVIRLIRDRFAADLTDVASEAVFDPGVTGERRAPQPVHDPGVAARVAATWADLTELAKATEALA